MAKRIPFDTESVIGKTFHDLTLVKFLRDDTKRTRRCIQHKYIYLADCACGKKGFEVIFGSVKGGFKKSCGCGLIRARKKFKKYNNLHLSNKSEENKIKSGWRKHE